MNFELSEEQEMLRDGARRFVREQYDFESRRRLVRSEHGFSQDHWTQFAELGWLALSLSEESGGLGCSFVETTLLLEEFGRGLVLEPYVSSAVLCAHVLEHAEAGATRTETLQALAEGQRRLALAHLEPGQRQPDAPIEAVATRIDGGFVLDGNKGVVIDGPSANQFIVSARLDTDAPGSFSLWLVDARAPGVSATSYPLIDGSRAADLQFKRAPCVALLASGAKAEEILSEALDRDTLARVAYALGAMESVLSNTSEYLKSRVQFGQPIGKFQALQHRMADMFVEVQAVRSILYCGLANLAAEPAVRSAIVSAAKVVTAEAGKFVGGQGIQLHGGIGVTDECSISHFYKALVAFDKLYADSDWHLGRFAAFAAR